MTQVSCSKNVLLKLQTEKQYYTRTFVLVYNAIDSTAKCGHQKILYILNML